MALVQTVEAAEKGAAPCASAREAAGTLQAQPGYIPCITNHLIWTGRMPVSTHTGASSTSDVISCSRPLFRHTASDGAPGSG